MYRDFGSDNMALSKEIQNKSLRSLIQKYARHLNETGRKLIELINNLAAADDIPLYVQNQNVIDLLIKTIKDSQSEHNPDLEGTSYFIYGLITEKMEAQSEINRQRHLMQGRFDETALHLRTERDQMQDHDMTLLMPKSQGHIVVMAVLNRHDPHSANAIIDTLASDVFNPEIHHIMIPLGPGHWRGVYLSKSQGRISDKIYDLELFDPYGPAGAAVLDDYVLDLFNQCGVPKELVNIRHTGPKHPQGDAYSCGDFTCAYSHKKMKEFGAPEGSYNPILIDTLDNLGNVDNVLRMATREETRALVEKDRGRQHIHPVLQSTQAADKKEPISSTGKPKAGAQGISSEIENANKSKKTTIQQTVKDKESQLSPTMRTGLFIGGGTFTSGGVGAIIGGLIGFFFLPGLGVLMGAIAGVFIGAGAGLLISGIIASAFWNSTPLNIIKNHESNTETQGIDLKSDSVGKPDKQYSEKDEEPIHSPPLFSTPATQERAANDITDELNSIGPKT
ncbi:DUF456 domain-containing protein [Legionella sp. PATHC032]|uniref:DUF456 domain-containing protein n=1 Tax=Legionella sp. PATHC032 TaxID=2992039 RepID=UPI001B1028F0|nr:DUF456 domain-containing protein [Legionella sp. PATHC032]MCW8421069.1 DUF456 domain-containing protein [Legionella sp. PATHC032]HAZ7573334.1 DUF456 domain-containing protein [Legionella pneumophila]HBA1634369.1 DUF456 domain-containing protein [Legionella pneumophila]